MRKLIALAAVAVTALVFATVAYAANVYKVTPASTSPGGAGTSAKPKAKAVKFGFTALDSTGGRASPIKKYSIGFQGMKYFGKSKVFPRCTYAQSNSSILSTKCNKALVGSGKVNNFFGASNNIQAKGACVLNLRLYNLGNGFAIRLDGGSTAKPKPTNCPIPVAQAIKAKFKSQRIGGVSSTALVFNVPPNLSHPLPNVDNSVNSTKSTISGKKRKVKIKGKSRKVSILSSIKCARRNKRTIQVAFTDETNKTTTVKKSVKC